LKDQLWRLNNLYKIVDQQGRQRQFKMNDAQTETWRQRWWWNLILKARQRGISTFVCVYMLDLCISGKDTSCGLIDATLTDATLKLDKIRYAYNNLTPLLKDRVKLVSDNATSLEWSNGSRISVGTSHRGGTLQCLHVSELGKIAATAPRRSREIRTGAFGTIHRGSVVFVESTAEGAAGDFYNLVQDADAAARQGRPLSEGEFRLIFLPWWKQENYRLDPKDVLITKDQQDYFRWLEATHAIELDDQQRAWYVVRSKAVGPDDMWREYPSYPEEAFKVSLEGAYFRQAMTKAREQRRIGKVTLDPSKPVNTFWDIGKTDSTAIWFHQSHGQMHHLVDYYENSGEDVAHYAQYLRNRAVERGWIYGRHIGPHDLDNTHWVLPGATKVKDVAHDLKIPFEVVPRVANKLDAIEAARNFLAMCWIDEEHCSQGIRCLDNYRKKWDENRGDWSKHEFVDWTNHGADALMTGACGFSPDYIPPPSDKYRKPQARRSAWAA